MFFIGADSQIRTGDLILTKLHIIYIVVKCQELFVLFSISVDFNATV